MDKEAKKLLELKERFEKAKTQLAIVEAEEKKLVLELKNKWKITDTKNLKKKLEEINVEIGNVKKERERLITKIEGKLDEYEE
jgi:hypothetical protein